MQKKVKPNATKETLSVTDYIKNVDRARTVDTETLIKVFSNVTKVRPKMWGSGIVGFGSYHYKYDSGREGDFLATGFAIRKSGPTIYIMPGYNDYSKLLEKLGPHKLGKSCLYLKNLEGIDLVVLQKLIEAGLKDLRKVYQVTMK